MKNKGENISTILLFAEKNCSKFYDQDLLSTSLMISKDIEDKFGVEGKIIFAGKDVTNREQVSVNFYDEKGSVKMHYFMSRETNGELSFITKDFSKNDVSSGFYGERNNQPVSEYHTRCQKIFFNEKEIINNYIETNHIKFKNEKSEDKFFEKVGALINYFYDSKIVKDRFETMQEIKDTLDAETKKEFKYGIENQDENKQDKEYAFEKLPPKVEDPETLPPEVFKEYF